MDGNSTVRIGLLGCGNVGAALVQLIADNGDAIAARTGLRLEVARVAVSDVSRPRPVDFAPGVLTDDAAAWSPTPTSTWWSRSWAASSPPAP